ncbi:DNA-binding GntR family transcriptional regulator [Arthrobacter sp. UYP6]|uniref:GntR family transcriptional regulator n=1 Tax=Arthrobacter sp. UYP6 TaxID=1756378 RepID=UPI003394E849
MESISPAAVAGLPGSDESAYEQVHALIASGDVAPGSWLREKNLAERVGVSRTPIREALKRLAAEGVVEISRNKGARVVSFTPEDLAGLYQARAVFEPHATLLAVPRLTENDVDRLADLTAAMEEAVASGTTSGLGALNKDFHEVFIERCGNGHFASTLRTLMRPAVVAHTFRNYSPDALRRSMHHHAELVLAARTRDAEWAESIMRSHILAARNAVGGAGTDQVSPEPAGS